MERISWSEAHARVYELRPPINLPWFVVAHATFHGFQDLEERTSSGDEREWPNTWMNDDWIASVTGQDLRESRPFKFSLHPSRSSFFRFSLSLSLSLSFSLIRFKVELEEIRSTISWLLDDVSFPCGLAGARTVDDLAFTSKQILRGSRVTLEPTSIEWKVKSSAYVEHTRIRYLSGRSYWKETR